MLMKAQQQAAMQQQMMLQQQQAAQKGGKGQKKTASIPYTAIVRMTQDGSLSLSGNAFEKLAHAHTHFLDAADTEWMLALAGVDPQYTRVKLAELATVHRGLMEIPCLRPVTPPETVSQVKTAARERITGQLQRFMAKHAAEINDSSVADSLLALNFLNPRNMTMFMSYLPSFDETTSQLANLLVAARLGERTIDEQACAEALRNMEDVIMGLRMMQMTREEV
jgi:hypothetical protein